MRRHRRVRHEQQVTLPRGRLSAEPVRPPAARTPGTPAAILRAQHLVGNHAVARTLAGDPPIRRDPAPPTTSAPEEAKPAGPDPAWAAIQKLIAEQLGEDKIKEYAKSLAGKGVDLLIAQVKNAASEADFLGKAQADLLGTMLSDQAKKDAEVLATSDAAKAFRERLLTITKQAPSVVIAAAIAAAAAAYVANVDLPELSKKIELARGLSAEGKLDLGRMQKLTVQQASAALTFASTHFSAGISGAYAGEGEKAGASGTASAAFGAKDIQFKGSMKLNPDGTVRVDLGQAIDVKKLGMETGVAIEGGKTAAIIAIKVGDKDTYVSGKTTVSDDGQVSLALGIKAGDWTVSGKATGLGGATPAGEASVTGSNIFGVRGLDAEGKVKFGPAGLTSAGGGVTYSADTKQGRAFISFKAETVAGANKDAPPVGAQGVVGLGFTFK